MPRLLPSTRLGLSSVTARHASRSLSTTSGRLVNGQDSTPGWEGKKGADQAKYRSPHDVQADTAQKGMEDHAKMKEGSQAISRKDENDSNKRAAKEHPEAPEPVIGMNEERGSKGH